MIVPTYNGQSYLHAALEGIVAQGDDRIEVLAIDDGSTDRTLAILDEYTTRLPLEVIPRPHFGNWTTTTNIALSRARGDHACFLHQDDCWLPGRLEVLKRLLTEHPRAALFLHPSWFIDVEGRRVGRWRCPLPRDGRPVASDFVLERLLVQNFISIPAPLFRRETVLALGGLDETLWYTADWDLWLKLVATGETVHWPEPLSCFRIHPLSQTVRASSQSARFRSQMERVFERHMARWKPSRRRVKRQVAKAGRFSAAVNTAMVAHFHGQRAHLGRLAWQALALGPGGWRRFLRDSRIVERTRARLRTRNLKGP